MSERLDELLPAEIVVVHFDATDRLAEYRSHHGLPDEIGLVGDPDRRLYAVFGIGRGSWLRVWGPRTVLAYTRLLRQGRRFHRHQGDSLQLGGNVIVGADGRIAWSFLPNEPDARPSVDQIIAAMRSARTG